MWHLYSYKIWFHILSKIITINHDAESKQKSKMQPTNNTLYEEGSINPYWYVTFIPHFMFKYQKHPAASHEENILV